MNKSTGNHRGEAKAVRPPIRGVALDMDGLLFDTEKLYWTVGDTMLVRRGLRYCHDLQQRMMGRVGVNAMIQMKDFHGLDDRPEDLLIESEQLYQEQLSAGVQPMPGLSNWIELLVESEVPFGLATSSRRQFVDVIFENIPWRNALSFVLTGDDVTHGKPHPEMYLAAASKFSIEPAEMLVLEDSQNGCAAAVAAGAVTVAIPNAHTAGQDFTGVALIADSLADPRLHGLVVDQV
ncbi:Phosphorylated carbohydrates phosphatase [Rubripirellula obstinata]|uniref:Phosphorylated carbohydrates phosphatase n=1 Tax=Rubripirellula obstinata TaxID=406547 RepID=A0A5B1CGR8_9BACT|nr:HAD-IA family hydrolase [Rubripirellula obstinata]KAA1258770.1 Phosphorylated carbohydrates phosphatase [Rubripirellula obstinata]